MLNLTQMKLIAASYLLLVLPLKAQIDYDTDDDGLIDVTTLEQLNAIRWDLDGDGAVAATNEANYGAAYPSMAGGSTYAEVRCQNAGGANVPCTGYELLNDLDFNDADGSGPGTTASVWASPSAPNQATAPVADGWAPIGDGSLVNPGDDPYDPDSPRHKFTATFDGNGHTISNLYINYINRSDYVRDLVGLFGMMNGAEIRNLGLLGGSVAGNAVIGGLVGANFEGTITACYATGSVTGVDGSTGGLVGGNAGTITACHATGSVTGVDGNTGGLVGYNEGTITACYATGSVAGEDDTGGLVGYNEGTVTASYATGDVTGRGAGGLVGYNEGTITACYATGYVTGGNCRRTRGIQ